MPAAVAAFALVAIAGAVLMFAAPSGPRGLTLPPPEDVVVWPDPTPTAVVIAEERAHAQALAAGLARARALLANQRALVVAADTNGSGDDTRTVGSVLLILGLTGIVLLTLFWLWVGNGRPSRRHTQFDDRPSGPA